MKYPACEKLEIIQLVEHSHLPVRRTLMKLGIPRRLSIAGMICIAPAARCLRRSLAPAGSRLEPAS